MVAKELRIGNLVEKGNELFEADFITIKMANNYKPIPLTKEILLKFGFEKQETILHTFFENDYGDFYFSLQLMNNNSFHLRIRNDSQENERYTGLGIFKYVHQLQNLYFALTGEEL